MAQETCFKCKGKGKIEQYSWNKGGICFTCGGDGKVNTFSTIKLNKMTEYGDMRDYALHSSTRDLATLFASGDFAKLEDAQLRAVRKVFRDRADEVFDINARDFAFATTEDIGDTVLKELDKREKEMPETYKKSAYYKAGKVSLVPVHWLQKFQGNSLRRDHNEMKQFAEQLLEEGLQDPVMIIIGQEDRKVSIGEGNHRTFAHIMAGVDNIPARVIRQRTNEGGVYYDRMSNVPKDDYFKGDAKPEEVFDTFYDHAELPAEPEPEPVEEPEDDFDFDDEDLDSLDLLDDGDDISIDDILNLL